MNGSSSIREYYGNEVKISDFVTATKTDETKDYILSGWQDEDGAIYGVNDSVTVTKDTKLTAIWADGKYKEYKLTYVLDGTKISETTVPYDAELTDPGIPKEAEGRHFNGWEWWSGSGMLAQMPERMPAADVTAYGTTTKRYVSYELDGSVYKTREEVAIGSTVQVAEKPEFTGYDVSDWTADGVTITDGSFIMPDADVVLKAVSIPKKYQVTVTIDGTPVAGSPFDVEYNTDLNFQKPRKKKV